MTLINSLGNFSFLSLVFYFSAGTILSLLATVVMNVSQDKSLDVSDLIIGFVKPYLYAIKHIIKRPINFGITLLGFISSIFVLDSSVNFSLGIATVLFASIYVFGFFLKKPKAFIKKEISLFKASLAIKKEIDANSSSFSKNP